MTMAARDPHHRGGQASRPLFGGPLGENVANDAGFGHVHPHQLQRTLATQAVNRGMHVEAVAELLGTA